MERREQAVGRVAKSLLPVLMVVGLTAGAVSAAQAAAAVRIMPLGDSITYGVGGTNGNGYRGPLFDQLRNDGLVDAASVKFVGSQTAGIMCDNWNEGHSGWIIDEISGAGRSASPTARPNVVLVHAGTNDMNRNIDVANAPARLGRLIDQTFQDNPNATVVVAQIIRSNNTTTDARVQNYNNQLPAIVQARLNAGRRIVLVDMWRALGPSDLADDLHPNDSGFQKMASVWRQGIDQAISRGWVSAPAVAGGGCTGGARVGRWLPQGLVAYGVGTTGDRIRFADVDGDRRADYLYVRDDSSVELWINGGANGSGGWNWYPRGVIATGVGTTGSHIQFADLNGDGKADYLNVRDDSSVELWLNGGANGSGGWNWYPRGVIATGVGATGDRIRFADIDGDSKADYLYLRDNGSVEMWGNGGERSSGGWNWFPRGMIATGVGDPGSQIRFASLYGTRRADYADVQPNSAVKLWANAGVGSWADQGTVASGVGASGSRIRFADLDGDGRADYLYVHDNSGVEAWLNKP